MPAGGFRPNAGRKSNKQKLLDQAACIEAMGSWFTLDFQKSKWVELLDSDKPDVVVKAMSYLSDRVYGRSPQSMQLSGADGAPLEFQVVLAERIGEARERNK